MGVLLLILLALSCCPNKISASRIQSPPSAYSRKLGRGDLYHQYYSQQNQHHQPPQHYLQYHHQINHHNPGDGLSEGILADGDPRQNGEEEEDPNWWDGAEEIDLTQKTHSSYPDPYSDSLQLLPLSSFQDGVHDALKPPESLFFGSCGNENACELGAFPPPPELFVPPPPVPPFMPGLAAMFGTEGVLAGEELPPAAGGRTTDESCTLCQWANEGNSSAVFVVENEESDSGLAGLLAGVAVGSAITGAILTAVLIRCRKSKILPTGKDSCPVLSRGSWSTSAAERSNAAPKPPAAGHSSAPSEGVDPMSSGGDTTTRTGWAMKLWRRGSSQDRPLRPASSYSSENSYTEEPYVNPDGQSALYAELTPGLNTYSEIPDPGRPPHHIAQPNFVVGVSDYGYGNSAYALSETPSEPAESSSTPSSAYYSDVSTDAHANKKKRKKKKGNERGDVIMSTGCSFGMIPTNISSTVPIMAARIGDNMIPLSSSELYRNSSTQEGLPMSVGFLPRSYSLERQGVTYSCTPCHACTPISTLPIMRHACELSAVVLSPANHAVIAHHLAPCSSDPSVKFAAKTSVGQVYHHGSRAPDLQAVNTVTCSSHAGRGPLMCTNPQLVCRQEEPLPCPPSEYV